MLCSESKLRKRKLKLDETLLSRDSRDQGVVAMAADSKKLVRSKSGLRMVSINDNHRSPFELFEPHWMADRECPRCTECKGKFDFMNRRHHCRRCGRIFCNDCCSTKLALPRMCFIDPVRICHECTDATRKENDFYDKHLKTLTGGANLVLSGGDDDDESTNEMYPFFCKLSSDHRFIVFDGQDSKRDPVDVSGIVSTQIVRSGSVDLEGNGIAGELKIVYADAQKSRRALHFMCASIPNKKLSSSWMIALHKAIRLMNEAQNATAT